jgi:hypothetical protein
VGAASWVWRRPIAVLAAVALLLQIALSFGHMHGLDTASANHPVAAALDAGGSGQPQHPDGDDHESRHCAICAILALLSGAQTAAAPVLAVPALPAAARVAGEAAILRLLARHDAFRSRAPPLA